MLSRFSRYLERHWDFGDMVDRVRDGRHGPDIPASAVFLGVFGMHALRLPSFNGLEIQLRIPGRWDCWLGPDKPSADTLGYALERCDLEPHRENLAQAARQFKRKKALNRLYPDSHWLAAIDGFEPYKSRKRCCPECCQRNLGTEEKPDIEYYHRYVALQLVGVVPALPLDLEPVLPGETEVGAALRLLPRVKARYPRFIDALTVDAFYLQAPFVQKVLELGYHLVVVLKQENRELYQDAEGLFKITAAQTINGIGKTTQAWDVDGLTSWSQLGRTVRVVRRLEKETLRERIAGQWVAREVERDWRWAVISPDGKAKPAADLVGKWGHARWDEETRGFGELTQHWHLDHCHHHHPVAMLACLLILFLAFCLTTVFFDRNLKPAVREGKTRLALAHLLADDLVLGGWAARWSHPP